MKYHDVAFCLLSVAALLTGCAAPQGNNNFNSTLWMQTSAEYTANSTQAYNAALSNIERAQHDPAWTAALEQGPDFVALPTAVILDIDETVLDNARYQAELILKEAEFSPATWDQWLAMRAATAVPGAVAFINSMAKRGIEVFYITNRKCTSRRSSDAVCPQEQETIDNLKRVGIGDVQPDHLLLKGEKPGWTSEKKSRRAAVAKKYRVLMLFGDDLGDFLADVKSNITPGERKALVQTYSSFWGKKWFILSNPVYGSWLSVLDDPKSQYLKGY